MKKVTLLAVCFSLSIAASAQLKDLMRNKVNSKLNKNNKTESTTATPADTTKPASTNTTETNGTTNGSTQPNTNSSGGWGGFSSGSKSDIASEYNFQHNMHIEIESVKKGATSGDKIKMIMYLGKDNANLSGSEMANDPKKPNDKIISVYEYGKDQTVMYMHSEGKKNVMVSKYKPEAVDTTTASKGPKFTKTGRTKTILTYKCEEWTGVDENGTKYEFWMTNDLNIPVNEYLKKNAAAQQKRGRNEVDYSNVPKGLMMEMISVNKDGEKVIWKVTAINMNKPFTVKTSEYEYMGF
ncbi:MAG: hypothetical protein ACHQF2_09395 [Flavobacteriales bacterium]